MTTLPYSTEAESYVLGCMLWSREGTNQALELLRADDFADPNHRLIFRTLRNMHIEGDEIDPILVAERLRRDGARGEVTKGFLSELLAHAGSTLHLRDHAKLILHRSHARSLMKVTSQEAQKLSDTEIEKAAEQADNLLRRMRQGVQEPTRSLGASVSSDLEEIEAAGERKTPLMGIPTGFSLLDGLTSGWEGGQLVVVGAQTGMGKTSLMLRFALEAAKAGQRVLFCSLEMTTKEIRQRIYAQESGVTLGDIRRGQVDDKGWVDLTRTAERMSDLPLLLCGKRGMTAGDIAAEARRCAGTAPLGMVVVDYLQLVKPESSKAQRYEQVGQVARALKELAGELNCVVVTGAQLSRAIEQRQDKRPMKSDLRESGDIEHTADIILLLHWPYKVDSSYGDKTSVELHVAKHRQGEADTVLILRYIPERTYHYEIGEQVS